MFQTITETGYCSWHGDIIIDNGEEAEGFVVSLKESATPSVPTVTVIPELLSDEALDIFGPESSDEVYESTVVTLALNSFAKRLG